MVAARKPIFCTVGFEIGHLRSASNIVPIYFCLNWHFLFQPTFKKTSWIVACFWPFPFFKDRSLSVFLMVAFSSVTTSAKCPCGRVSFWLFCLLVLVFFGSVSLLLILLHHSFLFFLLVPPLSHLFSFLLPRPPRALEKDNHGKNNYLILFAFRGSLRKCPCANLLCITFWWISFSFCSQNMYLLDIFGICFEGVRDSLLLLLICCYIVVLVFGAEPSFWPTCLLCQHFWGFVLFCVRVFYFGCFFFFRVLLRSIFFGFAYLPHLGLLLLRCCVVVLVF